MAKNLNDFTMRFERIRAKIAAHREILDGLQADEAAAEAQLVAAMRRAGIKKYVTCDYVYDLDFECDDRASLMVLCRPQVSGDIVVPDEPEPIDPALLDAPIRDGFAEDLANAALGNAIEDAIEGSLAAVDATLPPKWPHCGCDDCATERAFPAEPEAVEPPEPRYRVGDRVRVRRADMFDRRLGIKVGDVLMVRIETPVGGCPVGLVYVTVPERGANAILARNVEPAPEAEAAGDGEAADATAAMGPVS